jgi:hypothetical protein
MENRFKNHDQEKVIGHDKQTIILDESITAETDELDPAFDGWTGPEDDEDPLEDNDDLFPIEEDLQDDDFEPDEEPAFSDDEDDEY